MLETTVPNVMATHKVMDAFRTGVPITPDVFHPNLWEGSERASAPLYKHHLVQQWLPSMPNVVRRLEAGGSAADVGCGAGRASITIAKAFPKAKGLTANVVWHDFHSDVGHVKFGEEWDASLGFKVRKVAILAKYADYKAKGFGADTKKFWLEADYAF
ncbi:MAG: hypothetical protein IH997_13920 [Proteobacteria bacterium]|nr:hypothetical protein [Pseudomonadota bacterium]